MSFFELFQPGLRYLREEKDRQRMLVAEPKFGKKGGPLGIDLEGGKATFTMPPKADQGLPDSVEPEPDVSDADADADGANADGADAQPANTGGTGADDHPATH